MRTGWGRRKISTMDRQAWHNLACHCSSTRRAPWAALSTQAHGQAWTALLACKVLFRLKGACLRAMAGTFSLEDGGRHSGRVGLKESHHC